MTAHQAETSSPLACPTIDRVSHASAKESSNRPRCPRLPSPPRPSCAPLRLPAPPRAPRRRRPPPSLGEDFHRRRPVRRAPHPKAPRLFPDGPRRGRSRDRRRARGVPSPVPGTFVKICDADELPRGTRKKVSALGKSILMFWYKDSMVAIESRSPAEGAFSEGFENARLTQDGCIVCPATRSTFDLKTGEIKDWYPDNPVLRAAHPIETCRPMEVFPCLARPDGVYVDVKNGSLGPDFVAPATKGGSNTSLENNNVYAVEPQMVVVGADGKEIAVDDDGESGMSKMDRGRSPSPSRASRRWRWVAPRFACSTRTTSASGCSGWWALASRRRLDWTPRAPSTRTSDRSIDAYVNGGGGVFA